VGHRNGISVPTSTEKRRGSWNANGVKCAGAGINASSGKKKQRPTKRPAKGKKKSHAWKKKLHTGGREIERKEMKASVWAPFYGTNFKKAGLRGGQCNKD